MMASSALISNHSPVTTTNTNSDRSRRKKKKKSQQHQQHHHQLKNNQNLGHDKWKTEAQQQIYSSKLRQALFQLRRTPPSPSAPRQGRAVREAADRALAVAAKGRTRWSRAILSNRVKIKFRKQHKRQKVVAAVTTNTASGVLGTGSSSSRLSSKKHRVSVFRLKKKSLPTVQRKVRVLGRLVPGCRKQPLNVILEEATDYIPALEMQIRTMATFLEFLSSSGVGSASGSSSAPPPTS